MTEKRYVYNVHKNCIETDTGEFVAYLDSVDGISIARKWNELAEENEQLKHSIKCLEADKMELQQYIKRMQGEVNDKETI